MESIKNFFLGLFALLAGCAALFTFGKKQGKEEVKKDFEMKIKEDELIAEFKKETIHNEVSNSDLDDLVASNNARYGSGTK